MAALTLADLREHVETDLSDDALTRLMDDATADVIARFGDDSPRSWLWEPEGSRASLPRPATAVTSVVENDASGAATRTLAANEYRLRYGGRVLEFISQGTGGYNGGDWVNDDGYWPPSYTITYTPVAEEVIRSRMVIDLVKLSLSYDGMIHGEKIGDYTSSGSSDPQAYMRERENVLMQLSNRRGFRFA